MFVWKRKFVSKAIGNWELSFEGIPILNQIEDQNLTTLALTLIRFSNKNHPHLSISETSNIPLRNHNNITKTVPGEPQDVRVNVINSTALSVQWKPPLEKDRNGIIRGYHIHVQETRDEVNRCQNR